MSRHGDVSFVWADANGPGDEGAYTFRLDLGALRRLQEKTNAGPFELISRLTRGTWRVDDVRETIRLGLVAGGSVVTEGGSVDDSRIGRLIKEFVDERPLLQSVAIAARILEAALYEPEDDRIPKRGAAEERPKSSKTESSPSPPSSAGGRRSATRRRKSTPSRSGSSEQPRLDS